MFYLLFILFLHTDIIDQQVVALLFFTLEKVIDEEVSSTSDDPMSEHDRKLHFESADLVMSTSKTHDYDLVGRIMDYVAPGTDYLLNDNKKKTGKCSTEATVRHEINVNNDNCLPIDDNTKSCLLSNLTQAVGLPGTLLSSKIGIVFDKAQLAFRLAHKRYVDNDMKIEQKFNISEREATVSTDDESDITLNIVHQRVTKTSTSNFIIPKKSKSNETIDGTEVTPKIYSFSSNLQPMTNAKDILLYKNANMENAKKNKFEKKMSFKHPNGDVDIMDKDSIFFSEHGDASMQQLITNEEIEVDVEVDVARRISRGFSCSYSREIFGGMGSTKLRNIFDDSGISHHNDRPKKDVITINAETQTNSLQMITKRSVEMQTSPVLSFSIASQTQYMHNDDFLKESTLEDNKAGYNEFANQSPDILATQKSPYKINNILANTNNNELMLKNIGQYSPTMLKRVFDIINDT